MKKRVLPMVFAGIAVGAAACFIGTLAACITAYKVIEDKKDEEELDMIDGDVPVRLDDDVCYYAARGKVYHTDRNCPHIAHHAQVTVSTVSEAGEAGKLRRCSHCGE